MDSKEIEGKIIYNFFLIIDYMRKKHAFNLIIIMLMHI